MSCYYNRIYIFWLLYPQVSPIVNVLVHVIYSGVSGQCSPVLSQQNHGKNWKQSRAPSFFSFFPNNLHFTEKLCQVLEIKIFKLTVNGIWIDCITQVQTKIMFENNTKISNIIYTLKDENHIQVTLYKYTVLSTGANTFKTLYL